MDTPIQWWRSRGWGARILAILALLYVLYALTVFLILPGWAVSYTHLTLPTTPYV